MAGGGGAGAPERLGKSVYMGLVLFHYGAGGRAGSIYRGIGGGYSWVVEGAAGGGVAVFVWAETANLPEVGSFFLSSGPAPGAG